MPQGVDAPLGFKFYHALLNRNQGVLQLLNPVELTCWPRCYGAGLCSPPLRGPPALFTMKFSKDNQPPRDITRCPKCDTPSFYVLETRSNRDYIRRRKHCKECKHRATFYEISQEKYHQLEEDSRTLHRLLGHLQELVTGRGEPIGKVTVPNKVTIPCDQCDHANSGRCSFDYPEAFTPEAYDCSAYIHKT